MVNVHPDLPEMLFKYTSPTGLFAMLKSGKLRFSRPTLFNDLFDSTLKLDADFDKQRVVDRALEKILSSVKGEDDAPLVGEMGEMITSSKQNSKKFEIADLSRCIKPGLIESLEGLTDLAVKYGDGISEFLRNSKVFCVSANKFSAPMWGNYADNLCGAVLGFSPTVEADSVFLAAKPIRYLDRRPTYFDEEGLIELLSGRRVTDAEQLYKKVMFTKALSWQYENEWRLVAGHGWEPETEFEQVAFHKGDLREVILGPRFDPDRVSDIRRLMVEFSNARLFRLVAGEGTEYGYEYEEIVS